MIARHLANLIRYCLVSGQEFYWPNVYLTFRDIQFFKPVLDMFKFAWVPTQVTQLDDRANRLVTGTYTSNSMYCHLAYTYIAFPAGYFLTCLCSAAAVQLTCLRVVVVVLVRGSD